MNITFDNDAGESFIQMLDHMIGYCVKINEQDDWLIEDVHSDGLTVSLWVDSFNHGPREVMPWESIESVHVY